MDAREKKYIKIAKTRAKEYLRKKKDYKTKAEKKAFRIAEKLRIKEWKNSLAGMDKAEHSAQMRAFKAYRGRINLIRNLIFAGLCLLVLVVMLLIVLL